MKLQDMMESKYLKQSDIGDDEMTVTVASLAKKNMARDDADPEYRWTCKFEELPKPMVMNVTNLKRMGKALGDDTDDWPGGKVIVYVDHDIEYGGNVTGGLRIKSVPRGKTAAKQPSMADINRDLNDAADTPF